MNKLSDILRLHFDVAVDEPFKLLGKDREEYKIDSEGFGYRRYAGEVDSEYIGNGWKYESNLLLSLIVGRNTIVKPEFVLKDGVRYYLVNVKGDIITKIFDSGSTVDLLNYNVGNYFRDYKSAVLNRPLMLDTFKDILNKARQDWIVDG